MDKHLYSPVDLLRIATQHAYCADHLLSNNAEIDNGAAEATDALLPVISLLHTAFELTLNAYLLVQQGQLKSYKNLQGLIESNGELGLSKEEKKLLSRLNRQQAFRKGIDYELWNDRHQLQKFCAEMLVLYERLQKIMPVELQADYQ